VALQAAGRTVGEALLQAGHVVYLADRVSPDLGAPVTPEMQISIQRAKAATVWVDGRAVRTRTHARSVSDLLAELNVALLENDYTKPSLDSVVTSGAEVRVVRVAREVQVRHDSLPFQTRWEANPEMEIDTQGLAQEGAPGVREQRDVVVYEDGLEVKRDRVADFVAQDVKDQIYNYGTKVVVRTLDTPTGPVQYWRKIRMLATSYSASTAGVSRSKSYYGVARCGQAMRRGIVAVDPRVIPLGTNVYVAGYGVGFACDTGSGILGKRIDLGYGDLDLEWWSRYVDVYILTPVPPTPRYRLE
jgi:3D (Asp-Asp-Asp) domain-containing protein